jgi:hypothetical protein
VQAALANTVPPRTHEVREAARSDEVGAKPAQELVQGALISGNR